MVYVGACSNIHTVCKNLKLKPIYEIFFRNKCFKFLMPTSVACMLLIRGHNLTSFSLLYTQMVWRKTRNINNSQFIAHRLNKKYLQSFTCFRASMVVAQFTYLQRSVKFLLYFQYLSSSQRYSQSVDC